MNVIRWIFTRGDCHPESGLAYARAIVFTCLVAPVFFLFLTLVKDEGIYWHMIHLNHRWFADLGYVWNEEVVGYVQRVMKANQ